MDHMNRLYECNQMYKLFIWCRYYDRLNISNAATTPHVPIEYILEAISGTPKGHHGMNKNMPADVKWG